MKNILLILFFSIAQLSAQTYTYKPLLSTTDWRYELAAQGGSSVYWYHQAFKITENFKEYTAITDCEGNDPIVYIREDIASRKVFYMRPDNMQEYVLFNFNLRVNDVINVPISLSETNAPQYKVIAIDTVTLPDGKHKRFQYRETGGLQWKEFTLIEGIGCTAEPFKFSYRTADPVFYLLNTYKGRECQFNSRDTCPPNPCTFVSNVATAKKPEMKVYPNPCGDNIQLSSDEVFQYKILNTIGQVLQTGSCQTTINMSELPKGLYVLTLEKEGVYSSIRISKE
ncbi:MAG: T9SS type A sorting domain-containing protein [Chitinophagaceae bacterium]